MSEIAKLTREVVETLRNKRFAITADEYQALCDAALLGLDGARDAGVVVPREPTFDMLEAGAVAYENSGFHDLIGPMSAAYKAMLSASPTRLDAGWMTIESAPRDGRIVLLGYENSNGKWRSLRGGWMSKEAIENEWEEPDGFEAGWYEQAVEPDCPNCWSTDPTHWMPLPPAPTRSGSE